LKIVIEFIHCLKKNKELLSQYQLLFDHHTIPAFIVEVDSHNILKANRCAIEFFSLNDEYGGLNEIIPFKNAIENPNETISVFNSHNEKKILSVKYEEIKWDDKSCYLVSLEDYTELIDFEKKKVNFISEMQDRERKKLSMDLHDGYAQDLVLLKLYFESISDQKSVVYEDFMAIYQKITDGIRSLSYSLNPPDLRNGLCEGLEKFFSRMSAVSETDFVFELNGSTSVSQLVDDSKSYHLYRIVQEFVNNSTKYAQSSRINLLINVIEDQFEMIIKDNGKGFDPSLKYTGMGLKNMRDRCHISNMEFDITTAINEGTKVVVSFEN
jgi:signal transduction histidine kinase